MVNTREVIAIAELCVYLPILLLTLIVIFRHGFQKQLGWIYLSIFCVVRLAGAGFEIEHHKHPDNKTDAEWSAILQSVGLSPLLMASLGLLKRVTDEVSNHVRSQTNNYGNSGIAGLITKRATANSRRSRVIQVTQLPTMIALILCVIGGTDEADSSQSEINTGKKLTKIGIVMFVCVYILLTSLVIVTMKDVGNAMRGEKRVYFAVLCALPFIAVRLLWSCLSAFSHDSAFSLTSGKPLIQLFIATIEEFVVVCLYTLAGLTAHRDV